MLNVATSILSNWVPQPNLHRSILGFFKRFAAEDGTFKSQYLCEQLLSKYADPSRESSDARAAAAFEKLLLTEQRNTATNIRLRTERKFQPELYMARVIIADVLGEFDIEDLFLFADFSNGASQSRSRRVANKFSKFDGSSHVTNECLPYLLTLYNASPTIRGIFDAQGMFDKKKKKISYSNELFTVPKSDTIDRVCAKEPDWNMYFQKGLGSMIRRKLKAVNIDLNDQTVNKELARVGSITNELSTLDLSSASDSITTELVYQLLPPTWFKHLDALRCTLGKLPDGTIHKWQLFSTMGNGFTFELESLIFYALARAVCYTNGIKGRVSVYGDDIIVPRSAAPTLISLLEFVGFKTNTDKTFIEGPFRESCGGHYYNGQDVTPFYIKSPILALPDLILVMNKVRKWAAQDSIDPRDGSLSACDPRLYELFVELDSHITDSHLITGGPLELSGRYIAGPGKAKYQLKSISRTKRPRQSEAYAYWLAKRAVVDIDSSATHQFDLRLNAYTKSTQRSFLNRKLTLREELSKGLINDGQPLSTEISFTYGLKVVKATETTVPIAAPLFHQELGEVIEL